MNYNEKQKIIAKERMNKLNKDSDSFKKKLKLDSSSGSPGELIKKSQEITREKQVAIRGLI